MLDKLYDLLFSVFLWVFRLRFRTIFFMAGDFSDPTDAAELGAVGEVVDARTKVYVSGRKLDMQELFALLIAETEIVEDIIVPAIKLNKNPNRHTMTTEEAKKKRKTKKREVN